jgi:hypothetical protein
LHFGAGKVTEEKQSNFEILLLFQSQRYEEKLFVTIPLVIPPLVLSDGREKATRRITTCYNLTIKLKTHPTLVQRGEALLLVEASKS